MIKLDSYCVILFRRYYNVILFTSDRSTR